MPKIRDFIYLDVDILNSIYSQVFEGVTERIIESELDQEEHRHEENGALLKGEKDAASVAEASMRTQSKFLYDHMYNLLVERLADEITDADEALSGIEALAGSFLVRSKGFPEVIDFNRLGSMTLQMADLAAAITSISMESTEHREKIKEARKQLSEATEKNARAKIQAELTVLQDPRKLAKHEGFDPDNPILKGVNYLTQTFYSELIDVTIIPPISTGVAFRGILDKRWLRIQPHLLRSLYGGFAQSEWVMVGQVTYIPGYCSGRPEDNDEDASGSMALVGDHAIRDAFRKMHQMITQIEDSMARSIERTEVIVKPLAVFRELEIGAKRGTPRN